MYRTELWSGGLMMPVQTERLHSITATDDYCNYVAQTETDWDSNKGPCLGLRLSWWYPHSHHHDVTGQWPQIRGQSETDFRMKYFCSSDITTIQLCSSSERFVLPVSWLCPACLLPVDGFHCSTAGCKKNWKDSFVLFFLLYNKFVLWKMWSHKDS